MSRQRVSEAAQDLADRVRFCESYADVARMIQKSLRPLLKTGDKVVRFHYNGKHVREHAAELKKWEPK